MLRNILSKLPVLTNISDVPVSPCNARLLRSLSPTVHECRKDSKKNSSRQYREHNQRRSYSFPSTRQKTSQTTERLGQCRHAKDKKIRDSNGQEWLDRRELHQKFNAPSKLRKEHLEVERFKEIQKMKTEKAVSESTVDDKKYYENYEVTEQYELEASKPRKSQSELVFNVFEYMEKLESEYDPVANLQPNNQRPFGSTDNVQYPTLMKSKESNVLRFPQSLNARQAEHSSSAKKTKTKDDLQQREYSTNFKAFHNKSQGPMELIDSLPPFNESGQYVTTKSPPKQHAKKTQPLRSFLSIPKPNKEIEEALGVAEECKKKLIESKHTCGKESKKTAYQPFSIPWRKEELSTDNVVGEEEYLEAPERSESKRPTRLATPWLSYSDTLKNAAPAHDESQPLEAGMDKAEIVSTSNKFVTAQKRTLRTETLQQTEVKSKKIHDNILKRQKTTSTFQKRTLATEPTSKNNVPKNAKSNLHVSVVSTMLSGKKKKLLTSEKTYVKTNNYTKSSRPLEPNSCETPSQRKKCFLPSKVRLKPPVCTPKPPPCPVKEPCKRSDDCLKMKPKKLPVLKASDCPCVETVVPDINPKMKRLCLKVPDPPRVCPKPPPCGSRADDNLVTAPKKLAPLKPSSCLCVEPPPLTDIKLKRLQKICVPEEKCYPQRECPVPPPCIRADDSLQVCEKPLPQLKPGYCPCVEPEIPDRNPKMRRLKFCFKDPPKPKTCEPIEPCQPRADDNAPEKLKKLPKFQPGDCACIEPPPMFNVPLKRLQKNCVPEVKCYPKKECPVPEPCVRADDCWELKVKPLPVIKDGPCICVEPFVPDKIPKLKRLDIECEDQPRPPSCQPANPCPPRADENMPPKVKKLPTIAMGDCKCVEAPPIVDVPLKRLQKICVPEEKCYPKKECPAPEPCLRADDTLCLRVKPLPVIEVKDCPCVEEPPMKQAPALKRLELKVCEPPRVCPKPKTCEDMPRADDSYRFKAKKLPKLQPGNCPCVDQPLGDAPTLRRLECKDGPEECLEVDPCLDTPRADMGCWEYHTPEEPKCDSKKKKKGVSYNSKRRYNTDSRVNLFDEIKKAARDEKCDKRPVEVKVAPKEVVRRVNVWNNRSAPTIILLKELEDLEKNPSSRIAFGARKMSGQNPAQQELGCKFNSSSARQLSTVGPKTPPGPAKKKKCSDIKPPKKKTICHKVGSACSLPKQKCVSTKCAINCKRSSTPVCCDKKASPYPAFSELAEEEVEPFSDTTQYTCGRKEYGFHPRYKKLNDPFQNAKDKKKYSTYVLRDTARDRDTFGNGTSTMAKRLDNYGGQFRTRIDSRKVNKSAFLPIEPKFSQFLKQKSNYGIVGIDNMSSLDMYPALSRSRSASAISRNIFRKNSNQSFVSVMRYKSSSSKKDKKCKPKKKKCEKFDLDNCPEPEIRPYCQKKRPVYVCDKDKSKAPFPAFTDCLDEELAENLAECPLERDKVRRLQPSCMDPLGTPKVTKPVEPILGKLDPLKEEECVKAKLAIQNQGLSQSCHNFGKFKKVMRAKDYLKEEAKKDCAEIERLKKLGKWPPKNSRGMCTTSNNLFSTQKRRMCKSARCPKDHHLPDTEQTDVDLKRNEHSSIRLNACPKSIYIRKYHVLCTKPQRKLSDDFDIKPNEVSQNQLTEDDCCKFMRLRNVQWRINNFQKWHRLQRLNSSTDSAKKMSSGTSSATKKFAYLGQSPKTFSTSATKLVSLPLEASVHRGISTTYILAQAKGNKNEVFVKGKFPKQSKSCPKFTLPNCPKKERQNCEWKYSSKQCKKLTSPYPAFSECRDYDISPKVCECATQQAEIDQLQPQYPILPEISSRFLPEQPTQMKVDHSVREEYVRHKYGLEKTGLTLDCNTFGLKRKPFSFKIAKEEYEAMAKRKEEDIKRERVEELVEQKEAPSCGAHAEWCRADAVYNNPPRSALVDDSSKPKPTLCESKPSKQQRETNDAAKKNPCLCKSKSNCKKEPPTIWQKVVNYFKARPNCPAPDDWKKKVAREKAEKFAKVAGLVVCDPKDLPKKKACDSEELPKVITQKCPKLPFKCDSEQSKRSFSTTCVLSKPDKKLVRNMNLISRTASVPTICHRWYSSSSPVGDEDRDSLDGEDNLTHKKETITGNEKRHFSTMRNVVVSVEDEDEANYVNSVYAAKSYDQFQIDNKVMSDFDIESDENLVVKEPTSSIEPNSTGSGTKWSTENRGHTGRRFYSRHANWHNLEDINKSLEEDEKKRLAKQILKPYLEAREHECEDDSDDNIQKNSDQGVEEVASRAPAENDTVRFSKKRLSFFDAIFHEPVDDATGYNQAKAFAAFQDFFHKVEVFSDVNYEEIETNKTNSLVQELDKLMVDKIQEKKEE